MKLKAALCAAIALIMIFSIFFISPFGSIAEAAGDEERLSLQALPSKYCMRDEYVVYAQHQDALGYCWNFAATMSAATTIMKATGEYYDFSELWTGVALNNCTDKHTPIGEGGTLSYQYDAMKISGLMLETDLPYSNSYTISDENSVDYYNFFERYSNDDLARCLVYDSTTRFSVGDVEKIKSHIYNHGSIYLTFTFKDSFVEDGGAYYLPPNQTNTNSNHAVSVIGWDDNFQREVYVNGSTTPTVYKGAWMILNSYTEKNGNDGISYVFYDDENIGTISGYKYDPDRDRDLYFYDKIESGYSYPISVKGKYYGDFTAENALTKQKNIFYDDVNLEYSYEASSGADIKQIDIYLGNENVTSDFNVRVDRLADRFYISQSNASYGQYKVLVTYGNGEVTDTYLNNFFVTHGLVGEEIEFDYASNSLAFNTGLDLEYYSYITEDKTYVIYTNQLKGEISFLPTEQSVYSEKNMSLSKISYNIENGVSDTEIYRITSESGYELEYTFVFEYCEDTTLSPVNVYYDLGGGINNPDNHEKELGGENTGLALYAPTREGYTFDGWYLDYGNGSRKIEEINGVYYVDWDDIHHLGEAPPLYAKSHYNKYYKNSSTLFVYARWVEEDYHTVDISITGEGVSHINETISVRSGDSVRYLLKPNSDWCLASLTINGREITGDNFAEIVKYGLHIQDVNEDISVCATFEKGVYVSLKMGDNIKSAYVVGNKNGEPRRFYDGDVIPFDYFSDYRDQIFPPIKDKEIFIYGDDSVIIGTLLPSIPVIPFPGFGTTFSIVVEVFDDADGYTYVLEDATSYTAVEKGIFEKNIVIDHDDVIKEITILSAKRVLIESVEVTYGVDLYITDHYLSSDINAKSGEQFSATYNAGDIIYLFVKKPADTVQYYYTLPSAFESIGDLWYRMPICVNSEVPDIGTVKVTRGTQKYTVTWENWDGSIIYSEDYRYGARPSFNNKNAAIKEYPTREDDELYTYVFLGWDKEIRSVTSDITYTARYEAVLKEYTVTVEPTENGRVTPDGSNIINSIDRHTYVFTPNEGYKIKDVIVNGVSMGAIPYYTFDKVKSNQTLRVEFEKIIYSVNVIAGEGGTVDLEGLQSASHGEGLTINITPDDNYIIDFIKVDGVSMEISECFTVGNITKDTVVEIAFKKDVFTVTTECSDGGSITPSHTVALGENARLEFKPKLGYKVKDVIINGVSIGAVEEYTLISVNADHTVRVEYERDAVSIVILTAMTGLFISTLGLSVIVVIDTKKLRHLERKLQKLRAELSPQTKK